MAREITQRPLRNESGEVMRALDSGESFVVTRNGGAVGELRPVRGHRYVNRELALATFSGAPAIDAARFRADLDPLTDQDPRRVADPPAPRGLVDTSVVIDLEHVAPDSLPSQMAIAAVTLAELAAELPLYTRNPSDFDGLYTLIDVAPVSVAKSTG